MFSLKKQPINRGLVVDLRMHQAVSKSAEPLKAILIILFSIALVFAYESKRLNIITANEKIPFLRAAASLTTSAIESLKSTTGLTVFFEADQAFWRRVKTSPKIFNIPEPVLVTRKPSHLLPFESPIEENRFDPPYRILIIGDSFIAERFGPELEKSLLSYDQVTVFRQGVYSTGLSRPDYFDWNAEISNLLTERQSNVVIVMFGANDAQDLRAIDGPTVSHYGAADWNTEYAKRASEFIDGIASDDCKIFWIGNPIARDDYYLNRMLNLNSVYEAECKKEKNCQYISTWEMLTDKNGDYSAYLPDETGKNYLARASDGIHPTLFGAQILVKETIKTISLFIDLNADTKNTGH